MKAVPEGARVVCPNKNCRAEIFEFTREFKPGDILSLDILHSLRPDAIKSAERCTCPACGVEYFTNGAISTHFGWYPYAP